MQLTKQQKEQILSKLSDIDKNSEDIVKIKEDIGIVQKNITKISKQLHEPRLCKLHDDKLKSIESSIEKLTTQSYVKARNGSREKTLRPITEVLAETHESTYWQRPFGLLAMFLWDFGRKHKVWSVVILFCLIALHDPLFALLETILKQPNQLFKFIIGKFLG